MRQVCLKLALTLNLAAAVWAFPASGQSPPQSKWCDLWIEAPVATKVPACTAMIESGKFAGTDLADIYLMRGRIYFYVKRDYNSAMADYDQALKLNPRYGAVFYFRSLVHAARGNPDGAISDLSEAIRLNPDEAMLYTERGLAYAAQKVLDLAVADLEQAVKLDPEDTLAQFALTLLKDGNNHEFSAPGGRFRFFDALSGQRK